MEDQVPFKAYTFWGGQSKPEVRRFGVEKSVVTSFHYLNAKLQDVYPGLRNKTYTVSWKDEDGDDVTISSDDEVMIALGQMQNGDIIKLYVYCKDAETEPKDDECEILLEAFPAAFTAPDSAGGDMKAEHFGVVCDSCNSAVVGFRYKCASCDDFDLCSTCEAAGKHAAHCMVRIPVPAMPHAIIKAAIKRSRHFLKTVAVKEECPYKKNKRERSGEGKNHRENEHHNRGERRERRECRRQQRGSWLDTFATYMNEFANLAGDVGLNPSTDKPQPPTQTQATASASAEATTATQGEKAKEKLGGGASASTQIPQFHGCPIQFDKIINPENIQRFMELQKTLSEILVPNLVPQPTPAAENVPKQPTPTPAENVVTPPQSVNNDVDMGNNIERQSVESDKTSSNASTGSNDPNSDKGDDWTVINKENDLMDIAGARPSAPAAPDATAIGFIDLPQEFQRVNINDGQSLYPPLNASTAALNPQEPEQPKIKRVIQSQVQPTAAPQPARAPQPAPAAQPQQQPRHPKPHVAAAIDQMLAMGFNNDGGWLTQLLENYDGNISAVLDLLTPVQKKK